jgi:hypothetical protein
MYEGDPSELSFHPMDGNSEVTLLVARLLFVLTIGVGIVLTIINGVARMRDYLRWYGEAEDRR